LPQGYRHSLTIAHFALAQELAQVTPREGVKIYQYINDVLIGGTVCIPPETLTTLEQVRMPGNKKELQHALGLLVFWRKHI
ncbi:hypothetical protein FQV18_0015949, partial [Eudyptula minor novaehollandiae]